MSLKDVPDAEVDGDSKVLKRIAPNDLSNFSLGRTKLGYTKTAIADWFWEEIVLHDLDSCFFTLMFDDTTNAQNKKELQLVLKYWSPQLKRVNYIHLRTAFLSSGKAFPAVEQIKAALRENNLQSTMLVQLGSDGPNVTKAVKTSINKWLTDEGYADLFDLGSCHAHNLHNALKKGCENFKDVHVLSQQISEYFKSSGKWEEFSSQTGGALKFITFFTVRWTTLGPATSRIAEHWNELKVFFSKVSKKKPRDQTKIELKILSLLESKTIKAEVSFVNYVASLVETVLTFLERSDQVVFQAADMYTEMLEKLVAIILMPNSTPFKEVTRNRKFEKDYSRSLVITLPGNIEEDIPPSEKVEFNGKVVQFVQDLVNYLNEKDFFNSFLYDVKYMAPRYIFDEGSIGKVLQVAKCFESHNQAMDTTKLFEELTLLLSPTNRVVYNNVANIDVFYSAVSDDRKSPELVHLFRLISALSISNAEVERNFSRSKRIISSHMTNLQEENFNSRKRIISGMQFFGDNVADFSVSQSLLKKVSGAAKAFKRKLEEQKAEQESLKKRKQMDEENADQIRIASEASEMTDNEIARAMAAVGKIDKSMADEQKALDNLLKCLASSKDQESAQELIKQSQLSSSKISSLHSDLTKAQGKIFELQAKKLKHSKEHKS